MSDPYIGEIRMFGGNFAPRGWAFCDGSVLPINQYSALFALIGTTYGGDGQITFALPDLRGRVPLHSGSSSVGSVTLGERGGTEAVTLTAAQAAHTHVLNATANQATSTDPAGRVLATTPRGGKRLYAAPPANTTLHGSSVGSAGGSQPHSNMQPYLAVNFVIALEGIFPSQS